MAPAERSRGRSWDRPPPRLRRRREHREAVARSRRRTRQHPRDRHAPGTAACGRTRNTRRPRTTPGRMRAATLRAPPTANRRRRETTPQRRQAAPFRRRATRRARTPLETRTSRALAQGTIQLLRIRVELPCGRARQHRGPTQCGFEVSGPSACQGAEHRQGDPVVISERVAAFGASPRLVQPHYAASHIFAREVSERGDKTPRHRRCRSEIVEPITADCVGKKSVQRLVHSPKAELRRDVLARQRMEARVVVDAMAAILRAQTLGWILWATTLVLVAGSAFIPQLRFRGWRRQWPLLVLVALHPGWWMSARSGDCGRTLVDGS